MKMKIIRTVTVFDDVCFLAEYDQDIIGIFIRSEYFTGAMTSEIRTWGVYEYHRTMYITASLYPPTRQDPCSRSGHVRC